MSKKLPVIFTIFWILSIDGMDLSPNAPISAQNDGLTRKQIDNINEAIKNNDKARMNCALFVCASDDSRLSITWKLLKNSASANEKQFPFRCPALKRAQEKGAVKTVTLLLEFGGDPFLITNSKRSLLYAVCDSIMCCYLKGEAKHSFIKKQIKIAQLVLELGANPNEQDEKGRPLLFKFIHPRKCALPMLELLLRFGADIDMRDKSYRNVFMYATKNRYGVQSRGIEYIKVWQEGKAHVKKKKLR